MGAGDIWRQCEKIYEKLKAAEINVHIFDEFDNLANP